MKMLIRLLFPFLTFTDCNYTTNVSEIPSNKILSKITNVLGQETLPKSNIPLFYLYDDGTVEKRIVME